MDLWDGEQKKSIRSMANNSFGGRPPEWDGQSTSWHFFVTETKWYINGLKPGERAHAVSRIGLTLLRSQNASVRKIIMKLDADDFQTEADLYKMLDAISKSPLGQLPLPDAGQKIGNYYRKLFRRRGEAATDFLIREDNIHDEMWRALQRLLKDMDVKWEDYGYDKQELETLLAGLDNPTEAWDDPYTPDDGASRGGSEKVEASPPEADTTAGEVDADSQAARSHGSGPRWTKAPWDSGSYGGKWYEKPKKQEKDLTQKLMEKGLVPLAAFDVIRGWMLLEMMAFTDAEKNMIKASTQNKLDYRSVSQALRAQWGDRSLQTRAAVGIVG